MTRVKYEVADEVLFDRLTVDFNRMRNVADLPNIISDLYAICLRQKLEIEELFKKVEALEIGRP